jgi:hypothetical protein
MFDVTPLDVRFAEHERRVDRINQDGWTQGVPAAGPSFPARLAKALFLRVGRPGRPPRPAGQAAVLPADRGLA